MNLSKLKLDKDNYLRSENAFVAIFAIVSTAIFTVAFAWIIYQIPQAANIWACALITTGMFIFGLKYLKDDIRYHRSKHPRIKKTRLHESPISPAEPGPHHPGDRDSRRWLRFIRRRLQHRDYTSGFQPDRVLGESKNRPRLGGAVVLRHCTDFSGGYSETKDQCDRATVGSRCIASNVLGVVLHRPHIRRRNIRRTCPRVVPHYPLLTIDPATLIHPFHPQPSAITLRRASLSVYYRMMCFKSGNVGTTRIIHQQ